jgi:hypothetical protein
VVVVVVGAGVVVVVVVGAGVVVVVGKISSPVNSSARIPLSGTP